MKGLELCKEFFFEIGLPRIKEELPDIMPYLAVGLGGGSQCHGNDDEISRDHGWGPGFAVWLQKDIKEQQFEKELKEVLDQLPKQYKGYGWADEVDAKHACLVLDIDKFMNVKVGFPSAPSKDIDWLKVAEERLFEITHYPIFFDAVGEVTRRFRSFMQYYPEDVWKKRLAHHLTELWRWDYQYVRRSAKRNNIVTAGLLWGRFSEHAMKVGFLLNREYAPYEKWLYVQFRKQPKFGEEIGDLIARGIYEPTEIASLTDKIEKIFVSELKASGFVPQEVPGAAYPKETIQLLEFYKGIIDSIKNPEIKHSSNY